MTSRLFKPAMAAAFALALGAGGIGLAGKASASDLTFQFTNPSFGGNPFNSSHLLGLADRQNEFADEGSGISGRSQQDLFARQLESRLLSSLSGEVADAIFGEDAQDSGEFIFGDTTIEFFNTLEATVINVTNTSTGETTRIEVPNLQ